MMQGDRSGLRMRAAGKSRRQYGFGWSILVYAFALPGHAVAADFDNDHDGDVDLDDYAAFVACVGGPGTAASEKCVEHFDGNGDQDVDAHDFAGFQLAFMPSPDVSTIQLAGNALAAFPFFDYVRAFNAGAVVEAAVDTSRFPEIAGATCDLYVVAAKPQAVWTADPSLVDVRPSGRQIVSFSAGDIQDNTFEVTESSDLDADAGTGLGVGYDVVLDCDQDATLSDGDYIDGLSDEAGMYVVHDTVSLGPLATSSVSYSGGAWLDQKTWYPTNIAVMGELPLVVISHGNGHNYTWYDYLQEHLASYGYVVMSHSNNTGPGIETASTTTLTNTDYLLGHLDTIGGGILHEHVDRSRITWIGHSRGGEGVCRAYDRLYDGQFTPTNYSIDDVMLVSSIAPNDYLGRFDSNPHDVNYHLLTGAADGDNAGWPDRESDAPFHVYERAEGNRQVTYVHGADHNDFNCCGFNDFEGPAGTAIGRSEAQRVAKATYLALIKHYINGNIPAKDFLWRQYETLRPIGVSPETIVDREYREGPDQEIFVIDDFQSEPSLQVSSSGGSVAYNVQNMWEGQLDDADGTFTWNPADPMNGMVRGRTDDLANGLVFDWSPGQSRFLEFSIVPAARDFSEYAYLSFRACQGTRHPNTVSDLGDLSFAVALRDGADARSTIDFGAYGAGIEEPYQRTGSGSGAGWQNEFETIRIRLTDFLNNGSDLDPSDIVAVRFQFGAAFGADEGRVGLDDLYLSKDVDIKTPAAREATSVPVDQRLAAADQTKDSRHAAEQYKNTTSQPPAVERLEASPDEYAKAPGMPSTPAPVDDILYAAPFELASGYLFDWRKERPLVTEGLILVLKAEPDLVYPRQSPEPVLYVGDQTAERVNAGYPSGHIIAVVPGIVDLTTATIWFGTPELPERCDATTIERERAIAQRAGIATLGQSKIEVARAAGAAARTHFADQSELRRELTELVRLYSPAELAHRDSESRQ